MRSRSLSARTLDHAWGSDGAVGAGIVVTEASGIHIRMGDHAVLLDPQRKKKERAVVVAAASADDDADAGAEAGPRAVASVHGRALASAPDPARVVSHAHMDHLAGDAIMTPPTLDFLHVRKPRSSGHALAYGTPHKHEDFSITLHDAGHILGSAMIEVATPERRILYTGDFSTQQGLTVNRAQPIECDVLITESTYGEPRFSLPPRELILHNLETWIMRRLLSGSVALGSHQLGRAQEMIAIANRAGLTPIVSADIAQATTVYNAHGHDLSVIPMGSPREQDLDGTNRLYVVPRAYLKRDHDFTRRLNAENGAGALVSGWCHVYSYFKSYDIEAQFALSDHATFPDLIEFARACRPKLVLTTHGKADVLAREIETRLGIPARPL